MIRLDDLKPKQIKEENFDAWVKLHDKKYTWFYKNIYLQIEKTKEGIKFYEIEYDENGLRNIFPLSLDTVKWLLDKKKILSKRIRLITKLAENEFNTADRGNFNSRSK